MILREASKLWGAWGASAGKDFVVHVENTEVFQPLIIFKNALVEIC